MTVMRLAAVVVLSIGVAGCGGADDKPAAKPSSSTPAPAASSPTPAVSLPTAKAPLPRDPAKLAKALEQTTPALQKAVGRWTRHDEAPPEDVTLLALRQQRVYRLLAQRPDLARRTIAELPRSLASEARDNVTATKNLFSLADPVKSANVVRAAKPPPAGELLTYFKKAERRFGVDWQVTAAVMLVETKFGRVRSPSSTGALGPMQFMPGTWRQYGKGNVRDPEDAVMAAGRYLHASGAPRDYKRAIFAYNRADVYVEAVQLHARQMKRDVRNYYAYYAWQAFVRTTRGDVRLTGPGR